MKWLFFLFLCPVLAFGSEFSAYAEYLYVKPTRTGLDFAVNVALDDSPIFFIDPHYEHSYRVGVMWECCLMVEAIYTDISASRFDRITSQNATFLPTRSIGSLGVASVADVDFKVDYNMADLLLGYRLNFCKMSFRPFIGAKLGRIDQSITAFYIVDQTPNQLFIEEKIALHSYGLQAGFDFSFPLFFPCLAIFGKGSGALLQSSVKQDRFQNSIMGSQVIDTSTNRTLLSGVLECKGGILWGAWNSSCLSVAVMAGYECQSWRMTDFLNSLAINGALMPNLALLGFDGFFGRVHIAF